MLDELLAMTDPRAVSMSSLTLPEVGVKLVVIGLLALSEVSPLRATLKLESAAFGCHSNIVSGAGKKTD